MAPVAQYIERGIQMKKMQFSEMPLSKAIMKAVADMGFEEASPIQTETIPRLLEGKDVIGMAQTGTGKTAAFAIPAIESLDRAAKHTQVIVLCPTRELVIQVTGEFRTLMKYTERLSVVPVYGGQDIDRQLKALKAGAQVVVGTPGRTMDLMRRGSLNISSVRMVVLDEADEMLDMGFREDIEIILRETPEERQTVMFSATMPEDILKLVKRYQRDPVQIDVTGRRIDAPDIDQTYFEVPDKSKPEALARLIDVHGIKLALVFCNTKTRVEDLSEILKARGYSAEGLHGGMNQKQRDKVMDGFRRGRTEVLVATDVAGRGIDVSGIEAVFNYDLPRDHEDYVHRIGRTARAGKSGRAFTFVVGREIYGLRRIEKVFAMNIRRSRIPSMGDLDETRIQAIAARIRSEAVKNAAPGFTAMVERLMGEEYTSLDVAAALLSILVKERREGFDDGVSFEEPVQSGKKAEKKGGAVRAKKPFGAKAKRDGNAPWNKPPRSKSGAGAKKRPLRGAKKKSNRGN